MGDVGLSQDEAERLIALKKYAVDAAALKIPVSGNMSVPLSSEDPAEKFNLDIEKGGRLVLTRYKLQTRGRISIPLVRLDFGECRSHRNPGDEESFIGPHLHYYKEGFLDRFAIPVPEEFGDIRDFWSVYDAFAKYCRIVAPPRFVRGMY